MGVAESGGDLGEGTTGAVHVVREEVEFCGGGEGDSSRDRSA